MQGKVHEGGKAYNMKHFFYMKKMSAKSSVHKHQTLPEKKIFGNSRYVRLIKTTEKADSLIIRKELYDPFATSKQEKYGANISAKTTSEDQSQKISKSQKENESYTWQPEKTIAFVKTHFDFLPSFWNTAIRSNKSKLNLWGYYDRTYVRRPPKNGLDPTYTRKTVKFPARQHTNVFLELRCYVVGSRTKIFISTWTKPRFKSIWKCMGHY